MPLGQRRIPALVVQLLAHVCVLGNFSIQATVGLQMLSEQGDSIRMPHPISNAQSLMTFSTLLHFLNIRDYIPEVPTSSGLSNSGLTSHRPKVLQKHSFATDPAF